MIVHVFEGKSNSYGFTTDVTGSNLPAALGQWKAFRTLDLERGQKRIAVDVDEAIADIESKGYHVAQAKVTFEEIT